jgi:hypothetical protein
MQTRMLLIPLLVGFLGCQPLQGPAIDLAQVATPVPIPVQGRAVPQLTPPGVPGTWRAWIPRQVSTEGEVTDGHWHTLSLAPPVLEVIEPDKPMPRAPKNQPVKTHPPTSSKGQTPALAAPLPGLPHGGIPSDRRGNHADTQ